MRIVVGCPVAERAWVLRDWLDSVRSQHLHPSMQLQVACLYTRSHDKTLAVLKDGGADVIDYTEVLPTRGYNRISGHLWDEPQHHEYSLMVALRNRLLDYIDAAYEPTWFLSLDSDVILPDENALLRLMDTAYTYQADCVSPLIDLAVTPPPAWNFMTLSTVSHTGERVSHLPANPFATGVLMAAVMMNRRAQAVRYRQHEQGEDIGWAIRAQREGLGLFLDPTVVCDHRMRGAPYRV